MRINKTKLMKNLPESIRRRIEVKQNEIVLFCEKCSGCYSHLQNKDITYTTFIKRGGHRNPGMEIDMNAIEEEFIKFLGEIPPIKIKCGTNKEEFEEEYQFLSQYDDPHEDIVNKLKKSLRAWDKKDTLSEEDKKGKQALENKIEELKEKIRTEQEFHQEKDNKSHPPLEYCKNRTDKDIQIIIEAIIRANI